MTARTEHTYFEALKVFEDEYDCGAANLKSPNGGFAYGMPKYSETRVRFRAAWPAMAPLDVWTMAPIDVFVVKTKEDNRTINRVNKAPCVIARKCHGIICSTK